MAWWTFLMPPVIGVALTFAGIIICERIKNTHEHYIVLQAVLFVTWAAVVGSLLTLAAIQGYIVWHGVTFRL